MSLAESGQDNELGFEVVIHEDDALVHRSVFDTLEEAEALAEEWCERVPTAHFVIEDRSGDHEAWELAAADTALDEAYPHDEAT